MIAELLAEWKLMCGLFFSIMFFGSFALNFHQHKTISKLKIDHAVFVKEVQNAAKEQDRKNLDELARVRRIGDDTAGALRNRIADLSAALHDRVRVDSAVHAESARDVPRIPQPPGGTDGDTEKPRADQSAIEECRERIGEYREALGKALTDVVSYTQLQQWISEVTGKGVNHE